MAKRERLVWLAVSTLLLTLLVAVSLPTDVMAQPQLDSTDRSLEVFESIFRFVEEHYVDEIDPDVLLQGALEGLFESLDDPYSVYLESEAMRSLDDTTQGEFGGVGMYISKQQTDDDDAPAYIEVVSPIEDTPAYRAGIETGDLIISVDDTSTVDLSVDEAVKLLRGKPKSQVTISIRRNDSAQFPVTLVRDIIEIPTVKMAMLSNDIAYLRITNFTPFTRDRSQEAITFFEGEGYRSLIIDLRRNPGGLLSATVDTADLFFDDGLIVGTRGRVLGENERLVAKRGTSVPASIPIVVLIDEGSASASEILAAALKERGRATLIGETTYGKGSVQQVRRIGDAGFRLTMSRYYTPDENYIDDVGVEPNIEFVAPQLDDDQWEVYFGLQDDPRIDQFVAANRDADDDDIARFAKRLLREGIELDGRYLRRLIRNELNQATGVFPVYDLDFDLALQETIDYLEGWQSKQ